VSGRSQVRALAKSNQKLFKIGILVAVPSGVSARTG